MLLSQRLGMATAASESEARDLPPLRPGLLCQCGQTSVTKHLECIQWPGRSHLLLADPVSARLSLQTQARRLESAAERGESHAYIMEIDANQYIDARFKSNLARFLNHR